MLIPKGSKPPTGRSFAKALHNFGEIHLTFASQDAADVEQRMVVHDPASLVYSKIHTVSTRKLYRYYPPVSVPVCLLLRSSWRQHMAMRISCRAVVQHLQRKFQQSCHPRYARKF